MPEYVATLARNERHYSTWEFEAADDEAALAQLKQCEQQGCIPWEPDEDVGEADALDPVLMLDRRIEGTCQREAVEEEMKLPGFVYFSDLKAFAEKVAAFHGQPVNSLCDTLEALIGEARAILGIEDALR